LFEAVSKIDGDAINGEAEVRTSLHLRLLGVDVVDYLSKLLVGTEISSKLVPVTTVFQIDKTTGMKADSIRVLVAKSLVYDSAIFIDMNSTYSGPIDVPTFANWINDDFSKSANLLQLSE
jgi:hypothetical protein